MTRGISIVTVVIVSGCVANAPGGSGPPGSGSDPGNGGNPPGGDPGDTYTWSTGTFGGCSLPCGSGEQVRTVSCIDSDGAAVSDSLCTDPKPDVAEACNTQSCSNTTCTPYFNEVNPVQMIAISPATGPGPLTVTMDMGVLSQYVWDYIDFGDGTIFDGAGLQYVNLPGPNGGGAFACVNHTFISPGTYDVGRHDPQTAMIVHELTVTVQ